MFELANVSLNNPGNEVRFFKRRSLEARENVGGEKENNPSLNDQNAGTNFDHFAWLNVHKRTDKNLDECFNKTAKNT